MCLELKAITVTGNKVRSAILSDRDAVQATDLVRALGATRITSQIRGADIVALPVEVMGQSHVNGVPFPPRVAQRVWNLQQQLEGCEGSPVSLVFFAFD